MEWGKVYIPHESDETYMQVHILLHPDMYLYLSLRFLFILLLFALLIIHNNIHIF